MCDGLDARRTRERAGRTRPEEARGEGESVEPGRSQQRGRERRASRAQGGRGGVRWTEGKPAKARAPGGRHSAGERGGGSSVRARKGLMCCCETHQRAVCQAAERSCLGDDTISSDAGATARQASPQRSVRGCGRREGAWRKADLTRCAWARSTSRRPGQLAGRAASARNPHPLPEREPQQGGPWTDMLAALLDGQPMRG